MTGLRLRPVRLDDEVAVRGAHRVMAPEGFSFALGLAPDLTWPAA